jgi:hypothetical protein
MSVPIVEQIAAGVGFVSVGGLAWLSLARDGVVRRRAERRTDRRARQAQAVATEASLEEEAFAPEVVQRTVDEVLLAAAEIWAERESHESIRSDARVIELWARSVAEWLGPGPRLVKPASVDFLRVINRRGESEDRIVLRVRLRLRRAHHGRLYDARTVTADQRWTLARTQGTWILLSIDPDPVATGILDGGLIPAEWADGDRLREQSLAEVGDADAAGPGIDLSELVSSELPPSRQLAELANVDGRFARELLKARIGHIVEVWEQACLGSAEPLAAVASSEAVSMLLHPPAGDDRNQLVLRDALVDRWEPTRLILSTGPPQIELAVTLSAVRYVVASLTGKQLAGATDARHQMRLNWTLTLPVSKPGAWQLTFTTNPAVQVPGVDDPSEPWYPTDEANTTPPD